MPSFDASTSASHRSHTSGSRHTGAMMRKNAVVAVVADSVRGTREMQEA